MRVWTIPPRYLDTKGLVASWRECLLAKAVLEQKTKGFQNHPQLERFREQRNPVAYINEHLRATFDESRRRGYKFSSNKIPAKIRKLRPIEESDGQLTFEWEHLMNKLRNRAPELLEKFSETKSPEPHPLFTIVPGDIGTWEKTKPTRES